jgi:hypothetical protein
VEALRLAHDLIAVPAQALRDARRPQSRPCGR